MKKYIKPSFLILSLLSFLAGCIPLPGGEETEKKIILSDENFTLKVSSSKFLEAGFAGAPHVPLIIPGAKISKSVYVTLEREGSKFALLKSYDYETLPTKEQLDSMLSNLHLDISPSSDMLVFWNEKLGFESQEVYYMLDKGPPFAVLYAQEKVPLDRKIEWNKLPQLKKVVEHEISNCSSYNETSDFWEAIDTQERGTYTDDLLLKYWPECHQLNIRVEKYITPESSTSNQWKEGILTKADSVFRIADVKMRKDVKRLILASKNRHFIDRMDEFIVNKWPLNDAKYSYVLDRLKMEMSDSSQSVQMNKKNQEILGSYLNKVLEEKKDISYYEMNDLEEIAKLLSNHEALHKITLLQIDGWPSNYHTSLYNKFKYLHHTLQNRILEVAEKNINATDEYEQQNAIDMIIKKADCDRVKRLNKKYPDKITIRYECDTSS